MPVEFQDYYATLGVARDATADEIKKAFRKLARKYHPDVAEDKSTAEAKFKELNEAYEVLGDPAKRKKYDRLGARWRDPEGGFQAGPGPSDVHGEPEFHFGGTGFSDFFEQFFSGGSRYGFHAGHAPRSATRAQRGGDIEGDILVTLEEAMHGTIRPLSIQSIDHQSGQVTTKTLQVRIPPGATDGRRIRVPSHGEAGHGGAPAGDLFLRIRHAAHPFLSSRGTDLFLDLDIAPWEAVLGAEIIVATLDGSIKLRVPALAQNGQKLRVRARGLPKGKSAERGDLFVILNVQTPTTLNDEERQLWEKLRAASTFCPRPAK